MPSLSELKRDKQLLLAVLGVRRTGKLDCPICGSQSKSMSITQQTRTGTWLWFCHRGCGDGGGTIIDAVIATTPGVETPAAALRHLADRFGVQVEQDAEWVEPIIDMERAEPFVQHYHEQLIGSWDLLDTWAAGKRNLTQLSVLKKYRVGFINGECPLKDRPRLKLCAWVLPITDAGGRLVAVKLHGERVYGPKQSRRQWAPFGTALATRDGRPVHGTRTLWPPPEDFAGEETIYLCAGELKALAVVNAGLAGTSLTSGESTIPKKYLLERLRPFGMVALVQDGDAAGDSWAERWSAALSRTGISAGVLDLAELLGPGIDNIVSIWNQSREVTHGVADEPDTIADAMKIWDQLQGAHGDPETERPHQTTPSPDLIGGPGEGHYRRVVDGRLGWEHWSNDHDWRLRTLCGITGQNVGRGSRDCKRCTDISADLARRGLWPAEVTR